MQGEMKKICCVCKRQYGTVKCCIENDGDVTHGYCTRCFMIEKMKLPNAKINLAPMEIVNGNEMRRIVN
jgi:hypothetical protein